MSLYRNSQYSNKPFHYSTSNPYYIPFLNGGNPEPMYPSDALYDGTYQTDNMNPKYQYYGNLDYPQTVQRQNQPLVYYNPKPVLKVDATDKSSILYYESPKYPPYVYYYPNPVECKDVCGNKICDAYYNKMNNYRNCRRCQMKSTPQCWCPRTQTCVNCPPEKALTSCASRTRYGMPNPNGALQADVPPQNPLYTSCRLY
jgi:hypothetical protein